MANQAGPGNRPVVFFLLTFGLSWLFWIPAVLITTDIFSSPWVILLYLGGLGPAAAGILLSHLNRDASARKEYWNRVLSIKRIKGPWVLMILFSYPVLSLLTILLVGEDPLFTESFREAASGPLGLVSFIVFLYLFGPFPEELGWRGYALDSLQERIDPLSSSLVLGSCWAAWHIPLFMMQGTYQHELGLWSAEFWIFMLSAVLVSVFFTWIYNHNQNSILAASLFHFSINLTGNIFQENQTIRLVRLLVMAGLAVGLVMGTRRKGLLGFPGRSHQPS